MKSKMLEREGMGERKRAIRVNIIKIHFIDS